VVGVEFPVSSPETASGKPENKRLRYCDADDKLEYEK